MLGKKTIINSTSSGASDEDYVLEAKLNMVKVLSKQEVSGDSRNVTILRVVVHSYGPKVGDRSWNHWSIYLVLANGTGSVRANMRAESEGYNNGTP